MGVGWHVNQLFTLGDKHNCSTHLIPKGTNAEKANPRNQELYVRSDTLNSTPASMTRANHKATPSVNEEGKWNLPHLAPRSREEMAMLLAQTVPSVHAPECYNWFLSLD